MKKINLLLLAAGILLINATLTAQPWWVENVLFIDVQSGPNGANGQAQCIVHFQPGADTVYNATYDSQVFPPGLSTPFIYSLKNDTSLVPLGVNGFPSITQDYHIRLGFRAGFTGTHKFIFEDSASFVLPKTVYLEDRLLNTYTNIITNPTYTFNATIGDNANNRFVLHAYGAVNITANNATCGGAGSVQLGPGGSTQWQTYALLTNPGNVQVASGNYTLPSTINNVAPGQYTLKLTNSYNLVYNYPVTVLPSGPSLNASLVSSQNPLCTINNGQATISTTNASGSLTIVWNTSPEQTGPTATGLAAGTYIVTATDGAGCSDTVNVAIVAPLPIAGTLASQTNVNCNQDTGSATIAIAGGSGNYSIVWNTTPVQNGITAIGLSSGTYTATITDVNTCQDVVEVTITNTSPSDVELTAVNDTVYADSLLAFNATFSGTDSITWDFGDGTVIANALTNFDHSWTTPGTYTVVTTTAGPCPDSDTYTITVISAPVGINEVVKKDDALIWLNGGKLNIKYNSKAKLDVAIYNTTGQLIDSAKGVSGVNGQYSVNVKNASEGIYYVKVSDGIHQITRKLGVWD